MVGLCRVRQVGQKHERSQEYDYQSSELTPIPLRIAKGFPQDIHKNPRIPVRLPMCFQTICWLVLQYFHNIGLVFQPYSHKIPTVMPLEAQVFK